MTISDDLAEQTHQTFRNIEAALTQAGASLDEVVRVRYLITKTEYFAQIAPILGNYFSRARPAATMMIVGLIDPRMKIEIEVTARLG
jgi:enamine deaminase RidA (YjgF/YER057c/UK114 family)